VSGNDPLLLGTDPLIAFCNLTPDFFVAFEKSFRQKSVPFDAGGGSTFRVVLQIESPGFAFFLGFLRFSLDRPSRARLVPWELQEGGVSDDPHFPL